MIYFLDNQQVVKDIETQPIQLIQTFELDGDNLLKDSIYVETPLTQERYEYLALKSSEGSKNQFDMYRIISQKIEDNRVIYEGIQLGYSDLAGYFLEYLHPDHQRLNLILDDLLKGTGWRVGYLHRNPQMSVELENMSYKDALKTLVASAGLELHMQVEISGSRVTDRWIDIYEEIGERTGYRFTYGDNALQIVQETAQGDLFTALIGEGKTIRERETKIGEQLKAWREENHYTQEELADAIGVQYSTVGEWEANRQMPRADNAQKLQDLTGIQILGEGYGVKVNFKDVETDYKPKGQAYVELPEMTEKYGIKTADGMEKRLGRVEFSEEEDPEVLLEKTYDYLKLVSRPKVLFRANIVDVGNCHIGDYVSIHRYDLDIHYETRVRKVVRDRLNEGKTQVEIGDWLPNASEQISQSISQTLDAVGKVEDAFYRAVSVTHKTADGKNNITYSDTEPERKRTGDLWYRTDSRDETTKTLLIWTGEAWEDVTGGEIVPSKIQEVEQAIERVRQTAESTAQSISQTIEGTGFATLDELVASKVSDEDFASLFFQQAQSIGLAYEEDGQVKAMIAIVGGVPYLEGEKVLFNADEVLMDGTLTVTEEMFSDGITFNWARGKTFDASQIRVINLNADSITGGSLDLAKGLTIKNGDQVILSIDSQGRTVFNAPNYLATKDDLKAIELKEGPQGEKGEKGEKGDKGERGAKGEKGAGFVENDSQARVDDFFILGNGFVYKKTPSGRDYTGVNIRGPKGEQGEQGAKGDQGAKGEKGDRGAQGEKGEQGERGAQGEKGDKGDRGADGRDGRDGKDGKDGKDGRTGRLGRNLLIGSNEPVDTFDLIVNQIPLAEIPNDGEEVTLTVQLIEPLSSGRKLIAYYGGSSIKLAELNETDRERHIYSATFNWVNQQGNSLPSDDRLWLGNESSSGGTSRTQFKWAVLARGDIPAIDWYASDEEIFQLTRGNQNQIEIVSDEVGELYRDLQEYKALLENEDELSEEVTQALSDMHERLALIDVNLGEFSRRTDFIDTYILEANEGLFIGEQGTQTGILIGTDRISFRDNGREVASISQQLLTINRALLVESIEVSPYKFEPLNDGKYGAWTWLG